MEYTSKAAKLLQQVCKESRERGRTENPPHYCDQCKRDMGYEFILGPVCGDCCRKNHRRVTGVRS